MPAHQTPAQSQCTDFIGRWLSHAAKMWFIFQLESRQHSYFEFLFLYSWLLIVLAWFWLFPVGYCVVHPVTGVPVPRCPTLQTTILNMLCCCPFMIRVHMPTWESYQRLFSNSSDDFYFKREQMTNILRIFLIVERNLHCFLHFDLKTLTSLSLLLLRISRLSRYIK